MTGISCILRMLIIRSVFFEQAGEWPKSLLLKYCMLLQAPPDTIANAMYTILPVIVSGMNYARKGLKGFKRATKFSWKITAQKVLEVLESVV